jgi:hypothetical protein
MLDADKMESEFHQDFLAYDALLSYALRVHLHIERWLLELIRHSPAKSELLLNFVKSLKFSQLVTYCETLGVITSDLARVIRTVNNLRNEYAYVRSYKPDKTTVILDIRRALRELDAPFFISFVKPTAQELAIALASLAGYLERKTNDYRKTSNESLQRTTNHRH